MKKIKILIMLILLFPTLVCAVSFDDNVIGTTDKPSRGGNYGGDCTDTTHYWQSFTQDAYKYSGLRISFFNEDGDQVGNSVDVYNWGNAFYWEGDWTKISDDNAKALEDNYGFSSYKKTSNHTYYYSRVDYSKGNLKAKPIDNLIGGDYYFYFDEEAFKLSTFQECGCNKMTYSSFRKNYRHAGTCYEGTAFYEREENGRRIQKIYAKYCKQVVNGPLFYTLQSGSKNEFRNYFKNPEVMKRYMHLAQADELIKLVDSNDYRYTMLAEPVASITSCAKAVYNGQYTVSDLGYVYHVILNKPSNFKFNESLKRWPGKFALGRDATLAGVTYRALPVVDSNGKEVLFSTDQFWEGNGIHNAINGIGMAIINGTEVCGNKCRKASDTYKIVYRTIDLNNPFLNIEGKKRALSDESNWHDNEKTIDASIYQKTPKYVITLTPTMIQKVREDNAKISYTDIMAKYAKNMAFKDSAFKKWLDQL